MRGIFVSVLGVLNFYLTCSLTVPKLHVPHHKIQKLHSSQPPKGVNFKYDPNNYKENASTNYRQYGAQMEALRSQEKRMQTVQEEREKEAQMLILKKKMQEETFQFTPAHTVVASNDQFSVNESVVQIIEDLDAELIGLRPVSLN